MQISKATQALPLPPSFQSTDVYIEELLNFISTHDLHRLLTGGVHILDFFTRDRSLYEVLLESNWREWFEQHELDDLVQFIVHEDMTQFVNQPNATWKDIPAPPVSLVKYISDVRRLLLRREPLSTPEEPGRSQRAKIPLIPHTVAMGMKSKKLHEVTYFASYVNNLASSISSASTNPITHLVDFGSGQNYLGRTLASEPYNWNVIAVESKSHNVESARGLDVHAKLAPKKGELVNKKVWRAQKDKNSMSTSSPVNGNTDHEGEKQNDPTLIPDEVETNKNAVLAKLESSTNGKGTIQYVQQKLESGDLSSTIDTIIQDPLPYLDGSGSGQNPAATKAQQPSLMVISLHSCGNLSHHGIRSLLLNESVKAVAIVGCCYNLLTESLTAPSYKLPSLRRKPPTPPCADCTSASTPQANVHQSPKTSPQGDPHGFPMSHLFRTYTPPPTNPSTTPRPPGIHLNITARMMAVQAPQNWTRDTSASFFTRHFYRALLQRLFLDCGVVDPPHANNNNNDNTESDDNKSREESQGRSAAGSSTSHARVVIGSHASTQPIVIGSLRKPCYADFTRYVRGALAKLTNTTQQRRSPPSPSSETKETRSQRDGTTWAPPEALSHLIASKTSHLTDADIAAYETAYAPRRKELAVVWTLMAFSAGVVEAAVVCDRFWWLRERATGATDDEDGGIGVGVGVDDEQEEQGKRGRVRDAWVEPVFEYGRSPRNLVVVGVKE